jgi:hypothetical protein
MKKHWTKFKAWTGRTWTRFKKWMLGILAGIGIITASMVQAVNVAYITAVEYEDGTALPIAEIATTQLYCNDELLITEPGADGSFDNVNTLLPVGVSSCYATHTGTNGKESSASNTINVTVQSLAAPKPPELIE